MCTDGCRGSALILARVSALSLYSMPTAYDVSQSATCILATGVSREGRPAPTGGGQENGRERVQASGIFFLLHARTLTNCPQYVCCSNCTSANIPVCVLTFIEVIQEGVIPSWSRHGGEGSPVIFKQWHQGWGDRLEARWKKVENTLPPPLRRVLWSSHTLRPVFLSVESNLSIFQPQHQGSKALIVQLLDVGCLYVGFQIRGFSRKYASEERQGIRWCTAGKSLFLTQIFHSAACL